MQDVFIEYMVVKRKTGKEYALTVLLVLAAIAILLAAFLFSGLLGAFSMFGLLFAFGAAYGAYRLMISFNVEYEYLITNGEMDIDKITNQQKRKRLIGANMRSVEAFNRYNPKTPPSKAYKTKIMACDHPQSEDLWYFETHHKDKGLTLVVFNASERMINGIKPFLPRPIMHEVFRR